VNKVNGKFYIGVHKTSNPEDDYLGSGIVIQHAIRKYGVSSFIKEILFEYETQEEAWAKENELVEIYQKDPLCYNLRKGGSGGFDYINTHYSRRDIMNGVGPKVSQGLRRYSAQHPEFYTRFSRMGNAAQDPTVRENSRKKAIEFWKGHSHESSTKFQMSLRILGDKNPIFGKTWMYNQDQQRSELVDRNFIEDRKSLGWQLGRIQKWPSPL
jgi:hypothetical protein